MWENTRFGDQPFAFVNDGESPQKGLWGPFALGWFSFLIAYIGSIFVVLMVFASLGLTSVFTPEQVPSDDPAATTNAAIVVVAMAASFGFSFLLISLLCWAPYNAASMNRIASLISIDGARFRLKAKTFSLFWVTLAGWLITIFSLTLLAPVGGFLQVRYVMNRLEIIGSPKFAEIGQPIIEGPRSGESLGDAFDLDMGVGVI
jgi:uncharacterized membrane protein YjgN (DUF898 family)